MDRYGGVHFYMPVWVDEEMEDVFIIKLGNMQKQTNKHILTILVGLFLFTSCANGNGQGIKRKLVPNPENYTYKGNSEQADLIGPKFRPDTTIGQICLLSSENVDSFLGKNVMESLVVKGLPRSSVVSSNSKQRLTFYFHPGSVKKEFSEFQVNYVDQKNKNEFVTSEKEFVTESGIKLGMTIGALKSIKGKPDKLTNAETTVLHYRIDDFKNSKFLKRYNMPIYYADYKFKDGYLIEFIFGFEYP